MAQPVLNGMGATFLTKQRSLISIPRSPQTDPATIALQPVFSQKVGTRNGNTHQHIKSSMELETDPYSEDRLPAVRYFKGLTMPLPNLSTSTPPLKNPFFPTPQKYASTPAYQPQFDLATPITTIEPPNFTVSSKPINGWASEFYLLEGKIPRRNYAKIFLQAAREVIKPDIAAQCIQSFWRGYRSRQYECPSEVLHMKRFRAAIRIQSIWRGVTVRRQISTVAEIVSKVNSNFNISNEYFSNSPSQSAFKALFEVEEIEASPIKVQCSSESPFVYSTPQQPTKPPPPHLFTSPIKRAHSLSLLASTKAAVDNEKLLLKQEWELIAEARKQTELETSQALFDISTATKEQRCLLNREVACQKAILLAEDTKAALLREEAMRAAVSQAEKVSEEKMKHLEDNAKERLELALKALELEKAKEVEEAVKAAKQEVYWKAQLRLEADDKQRALQVQANLEKEKYDREIREMKAALVSKEKVEALNKQELALREREADIKREMEDWKKSLEHRLMLEEQKRVKEELERKTVTMKEESAALSQMRKEEQSRAAAAQQTLEFHTKEMQEARRLVEKEMQKARVKLIEAEMKLQQRISYHEEERKKESEKAAKDQEELVTKELQFAKEERKKASEAREEMESELGKLEAASKIRPKRLGGSTFTVVGEQSVNTALIYRQVAILPQPW